MNQELRQRLIGAVVVTALAAIFIPMLFDDPVDDSGQVVSELVIPAEPALTVEEPAKKLTSSLADVPEGTEPSVAAPEELKIDQGADPNVLSMDELEAEAPSEEEQEQAFDRPVGDNGTGKPSPSLDTGIVEEEPDVIKGPVSNKPKAVQKPVSKPAILKTDVITPSKTVNKTVKAAPPVKGVEVMSVQKLAPPAVPIKPNPEPSRWYIQAGSFSKKENALSLSESLRKQGMPVLLETIQVGGKGTFYRLKVGPELDKKRAAAMKAKLDQQNIKTILVAE
ncbi:MAG: SPOR domain-containing protein [Methylovulum sp.]|nr:SPOR domain-containing protein [Methylovulum sp.]